MTPASKPLSQAEFVVMLAMMISILAMSTDIMLPALDVIGRDLKVADPNDAQLVVTSLFLGFAAGQIATGPLSDSFGRKPVIYGGYVVFIVGCVLSVVATDFTVMLVGRVLQGLGASAPRVVSMALVRDGYEGRAMARIMSIVMAVFIFAPMVAPAIGQGVIALGGWRATFAVLLVLALTACLWFAIRQPETLAPEARRPFSISSIAAGIVEVCSYRPAVGYTVALGFILGAFVGYLSTAQQIFDVVYGAGALFPLYFATAAAALGTASVLNSRLVEKLGMRWLTWHALVALVLVGCVFLPVVFVYSGTPPIWSFFAWLMPTFFCVAIMFGNFNALAMEPLGHMAGLGSALVGSLSTFISLPLGWAVGHFFDGSVLPLVAGFTVLGFVSFAAMVWTERSISVPHH